MYLHYPSRKTIASIAVLGLSILLATLVQHARQRQRPVEWQYEPPATAAPKHKTRLPFTDAALPSSDQTMRDLVWGDVQFLHTTDIHGWYTPHHSTSEPSTSFSADWGHWVSFIEHMRAKAHAQGRDLVVVDTGDLVTGHGLSDAHPTDPPGSISSNDIFAKAHYDILTIGNHELYSVEGVNLIRDTFVPRYTGRYLTSNVNISAQGAGKTSTDASVPLGALWHTTVLPQTGLRMTSLGFVFNFASPHPRKIVTQPPLEMMDMPWFKDLMDSPTARETDLWLLAGHMPLDGEEDEWNEVVTRMRTWEAVATKPIVALAGHTHVRNCRQIDANTMVLQSGRFHETAGWASVENVSTGKAGFSRRYIDLNPRNLAHHAGIAITNLTTRAGYAVRQHMRQLIRDWNLNEVHGLAPKDWYLDSVPSDHPDSILQGVRDILRRLFVPAATTPAVNSTLVILNSGSMRSDIKKGPFTTNDQYIVSPFSDAFYVLRGIPYHLAEQVLPRLNLLSPEHNASVVYEQHPLYASGRGDGAVRFTQVYPSPVVAAPCNEAASAGQVLSPSRGYVTVDECGLGDDGDDTVHAAIAVHAFEPPYVGLLAQSTSAAGADVVDVITVKYLLPRIVKLLNDLEQPGNARWDAQDAQVYHDRYGQEIKTRDLWKREAEDTWEQPVEAR